MSNCISRVAQTRLGISFEEWKRRPVYKVQCFTASIANQLCGLSTPPLGMGLATVLGDSADGLRTFRCLPPYRDDEGKALRLRVARTIQRMRRESALKI